MDIIELQFLYDYSCPFVYRASQLLENVQQTGARDLHVRWRFFSLAQVNSRGPGWTVWGAPRDETVRGRLPFKAAEAARRQGWFGRFHTALLHARHRDNLDIDNSTVVERVVEDSGLDLERFRKDLDDPGILQSLARDHEEASSTLGVFGTPTFVFPGGGAAYVRLDHAPSGDEAVRILDRIVAVGQHEPAILEIKRPTRPSAD